MVRLHMVVSCRSSPACSSWGGWGCSTAGCSSCSDDVVVVVTVDPLVVVVVEVVVEVSVVPVPVLLVVKFETREVSDEEGTISGTDFSGPGANNEKP